MLEVIALPRIHQNQELQNRVAGVNKLNKKDIIGGIACALLSLGVVGVYVGISLKLYKMDPKPGIWVITSIPCSIFLAFSVAVTYAFFRPSRSSEALKDDTKDKQFKAALCLSDHNRISYKELFDHFYKDFFEGKLDFIQPEDVPADKLKEFFQKVKDMFRKEHAKLFIDPYVILNSAIESRVLIDRFNEIRQDFINHYINHIYTLKLTEPDNLDIFRFLKRMTSLSTLEIKSSTLNFVEHLPPNVNLTIDAENLKEFDGAFQNKSVETLTIKNLKNLNHLNEILSRFTHVITLTIESLEEVDQAKLFEIVQSLNPSVKTLNFASQNRPRVDYQINLQGWAYKPENNYIQFSKR